MGAGAFKLPAFKNPFAVTNGDRKQIVAGKTVSFGGRRGVRGQNIFEMVHSAYAKKRERANFVNNGPVVPVRLPAAAPAKNKFSSK